MLSNYQQLPIYDYRGKPLNLAYHVTYQFKLKNGYILALQPGQHVLQLPNLLMRQQARRA